VAQPPAAADSDVVLRTKGAVIGPSMAAPVGRLIYILPAVYGQLPIQDRYTIARLIGRLTALKERPEGALLLAGPGRWGTTEPTLGVPVAFAEISNVTVLCEVIEMREGLVPDVSLGTHFFNDLVEAQMLYLALVPGKEGNHVNTSLIEAAPNRLAELVPGEAAWAHAVRVIDAGAGQGGRTLRLYADALHQSAVCCYEPE
jgi:hypothetical protein